MRANKRALKVLTVVGSSEPQRFLIHLEGQAAIKKLRSLIFSRQHESAIMLALARGKFEGCLSQKEAMLSRIDLILTETNAHWSLLE